MNALDNVKLPMIYESISDKRTKNERNKHSPNWDFRIPNVSSTNQISGGQQQRVSIARALVNHPKVILPMNQRETSIPKQEMKSWRFSKLHAEGNLIIMVTHEDDDVPPTPNENCYPWWTNYEDKRTSSPCQTGMKSYLLVLRLALSGILENKTERFSPCWELLLALRLSLPLCRWELA